MTQPSQKDIDQLFDAIKERREGQAISLIQQHGKNIIEAKDKYGRVPLMRAAVEGRCRVVTYLLERGADMNARDPYGATALDLALRYPGADACRNIAVQLIENGADVNTQSVGYDGCTPLMRAVWAGNRQLVDLLLQKGADPDPKDNKGLTAEVLAECYRRPDLAKVIREYRAERKNKNTASMTKAFPAPKKKKLSSTAESLIDQTKLYGVKIPLKRKRPGL